MHTTHKQQTCYYIHIMIIDDNVIFLQTSKLREENYAKSITLNQHKVSFITYEFGPPPYGKSTTLKYGKGRRSMTKKKVIRNFGR